jgi:hypothetical protein
MAREVRQHRERVAARAVDAEDDELAVDEPSGFRPTAAGFVPSARTRRLMLIVPTPFPP